MLSSPNFWMGLLNLLVFALMLATRSVDDTFGAIIVGLNGFFAVSNLAFAYLVEK